MLTSVSPSSTPVESTLDPLRPVVAPTISIDTNSAGSALNNTNQGNELAQEASLRISASPPFEANVRYQIALFQQTINGPGYYAQQGQGSQKSRLDLKFGGLTSQLRVIQISDGRFFYNIRQADGQTRVEFVDVARLDDSKSANPQRATRESTWLMMGGLGPLLQKLADQFEFQSPVDDQLDGIPVYQMTGYWNRDKLSRLLDTMVTVDSTTQEIDYHLLPEHLPHRVKLTLGNETRFPLFPYKIVFERLDQTNDQRVWSPTVTMEFYQLKKLSEIDDTQFQAPQKIDESVDVTHFYIQRMRQFTR